MTPSAARDLRTYQMVERYKAKYPTISDLIRRGYSAERIAELVYCEVWVVKAIKFRGDF